MYQSMATNLIQQEMDCLSNDIISLDNDTISAEEAASLGLRIGDLFTSIVNNAKTALSRPFTKRKMQRSEFNAFEKAHGRQLKTFFRNVDISKSETIVVVPENFITTYPDAISCVQRGLDILNFEDTLNRFTSIIEDLDNDGVERYHLYTGRINKDREYITKLSKTGAEDMTKKIFNPRKWDKKKEKMAKEVFVSTKDMKDAQDTIENWESYHKYAVESQERLENLNKKVDNIIDKIVKMETIKKSTISSIHNYLYAMGVQVDMYGAFIHHAHVLEHNYIVSAKILLKEDL